MIDTCPVIAEAVERIAGAGVTVVRETPVSGGCIAQGRRLHLSSGESLFAKASRTLPPHMFPAEALGLEALRSSGGPRVPEVLAVWPAPEGLAGSDSAGAGRKAAGAGFILMEWIESGRPGGHFQDEFGRQLARMHRELTSHQCGFPVHNFIGSTPQENAWSASWCTFFAEHRIAYQSRLALGRGLIDRRLAADLESIRVRMATLLPEPNRPALLHGDLWGGNYLCDDRGAPVLIDPAVAYGHPEADLAMTELFGGFRPAFYRAYEEESPLQPGYRDRRDLYNLYHMLNHLNLFGGSYLGSVRSIAASYR